MTVLCVNELGYVLIISIISIFIFNFLIFIHFTNQIALKLDLAQKLKFIFKFSTIKRQMFHCGPTWDIKDEERMKKLS